MDYYGDFLSPLDRPPIISRRPSISNSALKPGMGNVSEWTSQVSTPSNGIPLDTRLKRRHTTCSIPQTALSATSQLLSPEMSWMLSSPRTTNYLTRYFAEIHPQYPFLNRADFLEPCTAPTNPHATPFTHAVDQSNPTQTYTRLLTAAIGALLHHQSRDISARYVRHAMSISTDSSLESTIWSSISGIHAAMLLAIYCLLEDTMVFSNEEEDTSHAEINLWLWNCRIAAG
ncbi:MAG: hypothetical protein M1823_006964, partial [Watsoniomyces obsoletus]